VLDGGRNPPTDGEGRPPFIFWDPLVSLECVKVRDLRFCVRIEAWGSNENYAKLGHKGLETRSRDLLLNPVTAYIPDERP